MSDIATVLICIGSFSLLIALIIVCVRFFHKHSDFVDKNSIALQELQRINANYHFGKCENMDLEHTYDNENFYNDISCSDYLIYNLQFNSKCALAQIEIAKQNKNEYEKYCYDVDAHCELGKYKNDPGKLRQGLLNYLEDNEFRKIKMQPQTEFTIKVCLCCSKINGEIYDRKKQVFNENEILACIKRIQNKNGHFYNDREIWNAICRVERGKVSNKMRFSIYKRDGYRCRYCGRTNTFTDLEIDHIIPIAKGGKSTYDNLQTLCKRCNMQKGDKLY